MLQLYLDKKTLMKLTFEEIISKKDASMFLFVTFFSFNIFMSLISNSRFGVQLLVLTH
jgi:hypothetical protein